MEIIRIYRLINFYTCIELRLCISDFAGFIIFDNGIGYDDGTFNPDSNMSRAEAKGESISGKASFKDVDKNEWYVGYVGYLEKYDVINGYNAGCMGEQCRVNHKPYQYSHRN